MGCMRNPVLRCHGTCPRECGEDRDGAERWPHPFKEEFSHAPCRPGSSPDLGREPSPVLAASDALTVPAATVRGATRWSAPQRLHDSGSTTGSLVEGTSPVMFLAKPGTSGPAGQPGRIDAIPLTRVGRRARGEKASSSRAGWYAAESRFEPVTPRPVFVVPVHGIGQQPVDLTENERGYRVSIGELEALLDAVTESDPPVGLTFDDGFISDVEHALPLLQERELTASYFPCAGWLDRPGRLDAAEVRTLVAADMPLDSHGWSHRDWRQVLPVEAAQEFRRSAEVLTEVSGRRVRTAAIPVGSYDRAVLRQLRAAGYERVCTSDGGLVPRRGRLVPSITVRPGMDRDWLQVALRRALRPRWPVRDVATRTAKRWRGSGRPGHAASGGSRS
jgi:peptidoglycan/xylan/chitin deacetylase (PgdA/CDA1 family)